MTLDTTHQPDRLVREVKIMTNRFGRFILNGFAKGHWSLSFGGLVAQDTELAHLGVVKKAKRFPAVLEAIADVDPPYGVVPRIAPDGESIPTPQVVEVDVYGKRWLVLGKRVLLETISYYVNSPDGFVSDRVNSSDQPEAADKPELVSVR